MCKLNNLLNIVSLVLKLSFIIGDLYCEKLKTLRSR